MEISIGLSRICEILEWYFRIFKCTSIMMVEEFTSFNNPDLRIHSQPAVNAISTARALADLHMKAFDGTLLSDKFVEVEIIHLWK